MFQSVLVELKICPKISVLLDMGTHNSSCLFLLFLFPKCNDYIFIRVLSLHQKHRSALIWDGWSIYKHSADNQIDFTMCDIDMSLYVKVV